MVQILYSYQAIIGLSYLDFNMNQTELRCLRCSTEMEKGSLSNSDVIRPFMWKLHEPEVADLTGFRLLRGQEGERLKAMLTIVSDSLAQVYAYRCPQCGYMELNAQRIKDDAKS